MFFADTFFLNLLIYARPSTDDGILCRFCLHYLASCFGDIIQNIHGHLQPPKFSHALFQYMQPPEFVNIFFYFQFIQESMSCANQSHRYERWTTKFSREGDQKELNRLSLVCQSSGNVSPSQWHSARKTF